MKLLLTVLGCVLFAAPSAQADPPTKPTKKSASPAYFGIHKKGVVRVVTDAYAAAELAKLPDSALDSVSDKDGQIAPGDSRLPVAVRKLTHLDGITRKGPAKLRIRHFGRYDDATLIIVLDGPPKASKSKYIYFPPAGTTYKGGLVKRAGVGKKPTRAQLKTLKKTMASAKIAGEAEYDDEERRSIAKAMFRKWTNFYDITIGGKPARLATIRLHGVPHHNGPLLGPTTAGVVVTSMAGHFKFALQPFTEPDRYGTDEHTALVFAFVDVDGDGTDEVLFQRNGTIGKLPAARGLIRLNGGKPRMTVFTSADL